MKLREVIIPLYYILLSHESDRQNKSDFRHTDCQTHWSDSKSSVLLFMFAQSPCTLNLHIFTLPVTASEYKNFAGAYYSIDFCIILLQLFASLRSNSFHLFVKMITYSSIFVITRLPLHFYKFHTHLRRLMYNAWMIFEFLHPLYTFFLTILKPLFTFIPSHTAYFFKMTGIYRQACQVQITPGAETCPAPGV